MSPAASETRRVDNRAARDGKTTGFAAQLSELNDAAATEAVSARPRTPVQPAPRPPLRRSAPQAEAALTVADAKDGGSSASPAKEAQTAPAAPVSLKDAKAKASSDDASSDDTPSDEASSPADGAPASPSATDPANIAQAATPAPAAPPGESNADPETATAIATESSGRPASRRLPGQAATEGDSPADATDGRTADAEASGQASSPDRAVDGKTASAPTPPAAAAKGVLDGTAANSASGGTNEAAPTAADAKPAGDAARSAASPKRPTSAEPERAETRSDAPAHARPAMSENALQPLDSTGSQAGLAPPRAPDASAPALPDVARAQTPQQPATPLQMAPIAIGLQALNGAREFQIRLAPDDLGRVDVKLTIGEDGRIAAALTVDRVDTLALLQRDARTLERAFDQAGFTADSDSLKFSLRQDQAGQQQQDGGRRDATPSPALRQIQIEAPAEASAAQWRAPTPIGGVDIRI